MRHKTSIKSLLLGIVGIMIVGLMPFSKVLAASSSLSFSLSPMKQSIVMNPGDTYHGSFKIVNPHSSENPVKYEIERKSFYVNENYETTFDEVDSPIVDWTTMNSPESGTIEPNSNIDVMFTIDVPQDAAAGGQYEAFLVKTQFDETSGSKSASSAAIKEQLIMTHLVFAEITGNTTRQGEIKDLNVPSFLLSGNVTASSSIKNTGNIHGTAKYKLQVFPLFSNEEIYTNEEEPETRIILPERTLYNEISWPETPEVGIFNVVYTVEFEGVTEQVSKMVIKCPIWLLFVIIFAVVALIIWIIVRAKNKSKKSRKSDD